MAEVYALCRGEITVTNGPAVSDAYSLSPITYVQPCGRSNSNSGERTQRADGSNLLVAAITKAFHCQPCVGKNATASGLITGHRLLVAVPCHQHVKELVDAQMLGVERCAQLSENIRSRRLDHLSASSWTLNAVSLTTPLATASCRRSKQNRLVHGKNRARHSGSIRWARSAGRSANLLERLAEFPFAWAQALIGQHGL